MKKTACYKSLSRIRVWNIKQQRIILEYGKIEFVIAIFFIYNDGCKNMLIYFLLFHPLTFPNELSSDTMMHNTE